VRWPHRARSAFGGLFATGDQLGRNQCGCATVSRARFVHSAASSSQPSLKGLTVIRAFDGTAGLAPASALLERQKELHRTSAVSSPEVLYPCRIVIVQSVLDYRPSGTHVVLAGHRCAPLRCRRLDGCRFGVYLGRCGLDDPIYTPTLAYYRKTRSGQPAANFRLRPAFVSFACPQTTLRAGPGRP
jgi:hypothetical protein